MRQRRRAERAHEAARAPQQRTNRRETERAQRRLLLLAAGGLVLLLIVILGVGWFVNSYQPPRRVIAEIDGEPVQLRDIVPYARLESFVTGTLDPPSALNVYARDTILRLRGGELDVTVTPAELESDIAGRFEPPSPPDEEPPSELGPEGHELLGQFLDVVGVGEADYRMWTEGLLLRDAIAEHFVAAQPETVEQVFVHWIVASDSVEAQSAFDRIEGGEEFATVAALFNIELVVADENGEVGWVPEGAFPEFDRWLYDDELVLGEPIGPLITTVGSVVLLVSDGPSEQPLEEGMLELLAQTAFQDWLDEQTIELFATSGLSIEDSQWVAAQLGVG